MSPSTTTNPIKNDDDDCFEQGVVQLFNFLTLLWQHWQQENHRNDNALFVTSSYILLECLHGLVVDVMRWHATMLQSNNCATVFLWIWGCAIVSTAFTTTSSRNMDWFAILTYPPLLLTRTTTLKWTKRSNRGAENVLLSLTPHSLFARQCVWKILIVLHMSYQRVMPFFWASLPNQVRRICHSDPAIHWDFNISFLACATSYASLLCALSGLYLFLGWMCLWAAAARLDLRRQRPNRIT